MGEIGDDEHGDRAHLRDVLDGYLAALAANDPSRLRVASNLRFTENGQPLPLGKGLWATATHGGRVALCVTDPTRHEVGAFAVVHEAGREVLLAVRLKELGGVLEEIETIVCRGNTAMFDPAGVVTRPAHDRLLDASDRRPRDELAAAATRYFEGILRGDGSIISVSPSCRRIENGIATANNPEFAERSPYFAMGVAEAIGTGFYRDAIEAVRDRRCNAVDTERGLVYVSFVFDHPGPVVGRPPGVFKEPNSMMGAEVFTVVAGTITHIEALIAVGLPYGISSGW